MKYFKILSAICWALNVTVGFAQTHIQCGTDEMHQRLFSEHPQYNEGIIRANSRLQTFTENFIEQPRAKSGDPYIIPIVFHVIHNYGPENISDAQILDAVKQLNIQYRKKNADTANIVSQFKSRAADCEIEFRVAQLDPDGNCTSGITRTVSALTAIGDHQVKSLIHWPPDKYLNVYICNQAAGLAGHAMMPPAADTIPEWDGIVMQHSYVGTIGTSEYFRRTVLSHEIGHFLNLYHIWGGNNVPDYYYLPVANSGNCAFDDDVADTPNTIGWQACNLSGQSCGDLDNVQNYMDYSYCALMFTEGQKLRMHAALNSPVAHRNNLWQPANLVATGTDDETYYLCAAQWQTDKNIICEGGSIRFSDLSYHGVTSREWIFEGGTSSNLNDSVAIVSYAHSGTYDVKLKVGNGTSFVEVLLPDYVTVLPAVGTINAVSLTFEDPQDFIDHWKITSGALPVDWEFASVGFESAHSFKINNFEFPSKKDYEFISQPIDVSELSSAAIGFDWSYGRILNSESDEFSLSVSNNCGNTWQAIKYLSGLNSMRTVTEAVTGPFVPTAGQWKNVVTNIPAAYKTDHLMVRIKFQNKGQNNFYIDNINIAHPDYLGIATLAQQNIEIYPNPANDRLTFVLGELHGIQNINVYNLAGKLVKIYTDISTSASFDINVSTLENGFYLFQMEGKNGNKVISQMVKH